MEKRDLITFWNEVHTIVDDAVEKKRSFRFDMFPSGKRF